MRYLAIACALIVASNAPAVLGADKPASSVGTSATLSPSRTVLTLDQRWRFRFGEAPLAVVRSDFDDSDWPIVGVPHSWNRIGEYAQVRGANTNNAQGVGWYRLMLDAPAARPNDRQYLDFAAVGKIADVWVNGTHVGQHRGAFARFRLDVTAGWKPGARNLIVVKADNSKPTSDNATGQVIPLSGDFFVAGGIYRSVSLLTLPQLAIDPLDHGGPGVYARVDKLDANRAEIAVVTRLRNSGDKRGAMKLAVAITDASGGVVARRSSSVRLAPGTSESELRLPLDNPHRWNGRTDPYLYKVTVTLVQGSRVLDSVTQPLGIRATRFDANAGFFLNGEHLALHGVSRHQDKLGKGWALSQPDHAEDMALIAELGANTVRQAHYQHADEWSDLADQAGMVVWAELPYVTTPSLSGGKGSDALWTNAEEQLRELIRQNWNHPSIMMWSVGNEVDSAKGFGVKGDPPKPLALLQHLDAVAKREDPWRPTVFADCCEGLGVIKTAGEPLAGTTDLIGYNRYYGWYMPNQRDARRQLGEALDQLHAKHPDLPLSLSEYGAGGSPSQHSDDLRSGFINMVGRPQPEEFQAFVMEETWPAIRSRDYVFASWVWNMFDFGSDLRDEGDSVDINTKGLVTYDRRIRKDAFYYLKAQWNPEPMIHLSGKRYIDRAYPSAQITAYSNGPVARLAIDGRDLGEVPCPDRICRWNDVALHPGRNEVRVVATVNGSPVHDETSWIGPDLDRDGLHIDAGDLAGSEVDGRRFGSDSFVTGGQPMALNLGGFAGMRMDRREVAAPAPRLYDFWRTGAAFSYAIPLPDGRWKVTIHSFEPNKLVPANVRMSIAANGRNVVPPFNVQQAAGGAFKGVSRSFPVMVRGSVLKLDFGASGGGSAVVAAIEITK